MASHALRSSACNPEEHTLLLTEMPLNPRANRENMIQIMFDTFNIPFLYFRPSRLQALLGSGRDTGVAIDSGYEVTHTVPSFQNISTGYLSGIMKCDNNIRTRLCGDTVLSDSQL